MSFLYRKENDYVFAWDDFVFGNLLGCWLDQR